MLTTHRIATAVCVAALVLSACGGDDAPTDEVAASEPADVATEAGPDEDPDAGTADTGADDDAADDAATGDVDQAPDEQPAPEPCPPGTQAVVPGAECNPIPEPQPEPEPTQQPAPTQAPEQPSEPEPTAAPQPASNPCDERGPQSFTTSVGDFFFDPADRGDLCVGDRITFTNAGEISHTATNRGGAFDTGTLTAGQSATVTIGQTGEIRYVCLFHSQMNGTLTVAG